ncbi:MAG TPA: transcription antitermination factor NusB [Thiotrichales bacterium]|nr:transcription antitermination factor NusB [Thiotrichales bacterium]
MSDSSSAPVQKESASLARARGKARRLAMQAIYQWQMTGDSISDIKQQFVESNGLESPDCKVDADYFTELVSGVAASTSTLDPLLEKHMSRLMESVDPVERAILRLAAYEFVNRHDVPYRVILNEAVNIAKKFCASNSHGFVNAVLDKTARDVRALETQAL